MRHKNLMLIYIVSLLLASAFVSSDTGCCELTCQETSQSECSGTFYPDKECADMGVCNVGCCIDNEGYCLTNYLKGNCARADGEFIDTVECRHYWRCISEDDNPLTGYIGYNEIYSKNKAISYIDPPSGKIGTYFTVKSYVFDKLNVKEVKARIFSDSYEKEINLYDDGKHGDGNEGDSLYANKWNSRFFPPFIGLKNVNYAVSVNGVEKKDYFTLTSENCIPLLKPSDSGIERDIVFIMYGDYHQQQLFDFQAINVRSIMSTSNPDKISNYNFYKVSGPLEESRSSRALQKAQEECSFYDPRSKTLIYFNNDVKGCSQNGRFIEVNPNIYVNNKNSTKNLDEFLTNFCSYIVTRDQLLGEYRFSPPEVTVIMPKNNSAFTSSDIDVSFMAVDDFDENLSYKIYLDMINPSMIVDEGYVENERTAIRKIKGIPDGKHAFMIVVEDEKSKGYSGYSFFSVNVSNYIIGITSLDPICYESSPDINFTISHASESEVEYSVYSDDMPIKNGTAVINTMVSVNSNLTNGDHDIRIFSKDSMNKTASTLPYRIYIGDDCPYGYS